MAALLGACAWAGRRAIPFCQWSLSEARVDRRIRAVGLNRGMYERFFEKWFGVDPGRERDQGPPDHPMVLIGGEVRAARLHASLTQRQVEELTGIDQTVISRLENGKGSNMPLGRFAALLIAIDAEIRPAERRVPSWMAPMLNLDDGSGAGDDDDLDEPPGRT